MKTNRSQIFIAALLHDIGKFYQRADEPYWQSTLLSDSSKQLAGIICPQKQAGGISFPTHQHVIWTNDFLEKQLGQQLANLGYSVNPYDQRPSNDDNLINLAVYHHRPASALQGLIQMADHWASGMERVKKDEEEASEPGKFFKKIPLISVFSQIFKQDDTNTFYTKAKALNLKEELFPETDDNYEPDYQALWESFTKEIASIPVAKNDYQGVNAFITSLLSLLKKYTSSIPASTFKTDLPSVSLYDHLRITAAIADCLYEYADKNGGIETVFECTDNFRLKLKENHLPIVMACIDLSGIQNFIYNISGTKAAKSMKGRSFYLQMTIDSIIDKVLVSNHLTRGHVIYASGGKAYLLMPNTDEVKVNFKKIHYQLLEELLQQDEKSLYVCMDFIPFKFENKDGQHFGIHYEHNGSVTQAQEGLGELWQELSAKTGLQKQRKFEDFLTERFDYFFEPQPLKSQEAVCTVTGVSLAQKEATNIGDSDTPVHVAKDVALQIDLGQTLKDADYIITFSGEKEMPQFRKSGRYRHYNVFNMGIHKYLFDQKELVEEDADFRKITSFDYCDVKRINNTDFDKVNELKGKGASYGFTFYGGNKQAVTKNGTIKLHDELAKGDGNYNRLGILRMDIDDLGKVFIEGLPKNQRNFATYATLSAQLDFFFSGYLNTIREDNNYKDYVNILYSGGDDVFAIGRWDKIIDFSIAVRNDFKRFVGGRNDITLSAGIAIVGGKYPIAKAADEAGEAESLAKLHPGKNAINIMGITLSWNEFEKTKTLKNDFYELLEKELLPQALLQKLQQFYLIRENSKKEAQENGKKTANLKWVWNAAYYLKRFEDRYNNNLKNSELFSKVITKLKQKIITEISDDTYWKQLALATRWAELEYRTKLK